MKKFILPLLLLGTLTLSGCGVLDEWLLTDDPTTEVVEDRSKAERVADGVVDVVTPLGWGATALGGVLGIGLLSTGWTAIRNRKKKTPGDEA